MVLFSLFALLHVDSLIIIISLLITFISYIKSSRSCVCARARVRSGAEHQLTRGNERAPRGQWERGGAERSAAARRTTARQKRRQRQTRLPLCAVTSQQPPPLHGLYSVPPTSAGGVPDARLPGLQRGVPGNPSRLWLLRLPPLCALCGERARLRWLTLG